MKTLHEDLKWRLKDPGFKKEFSSIQSELDIIRALVEARKSKKMTQKELARITGIHQADISKLENGSRPLSLNMLKKLADGLDLNLRVNFSPKYNS